MDFILPNGQRASEYFKEAFFKLYKENEKPDIKPEQYTKNLEVMLQISTTWF